MEEGAVFEFFDNVELATNAVKQYQEKETATFAVYRHEKNFGNTAVKGGKHDVLWKDKHIIYDGIPYMVLSRKDLDCQHGADRKTAQKKKMQSKKATDHIQVKPRNIVQDSIKFGCKAQILMREIVKFPDFKITQDSVKRRNNASKKLRNMIADASHDSEINFERKIWVLFPSNDEHNHPTNHGNAFHQKVDARIIAEIYRLVEDGVRNVNEMRRHLKSYTENVLFKDRPLPSTLNRQYYPRKVDVHNNMYKASVKLRFSKLDQENVEAQVQQWQLQDPSASYHLRLYELDNKSSGSKTSSFQCQSVDEKDHDIDRGDDENSESEDDIRPITSNTIKKFLFAYQSGWQKRLLQRYGNDLCLLDATYRTTKYSLPLFFLAVKTNVSYIVVGSFIIQDETTNSITEAMNLFKIWNPEWKPKCFMTDYCKEEITAVESVFTDCRVLICDFHREQAWLRWCNTAANGVACIKESVLTQLRKIATASDPKAFTECLKVFQLSALWSQKISEKLREWFTKYWLPVKEISRWAWCFRKDLFLIGVNTNNGVERQNEAFKYDHLKRNRNNTLSGMLAVLVNDFLPSSYKSYVELNTRYSSLFRRYSGKIPKYLHNRPRSFVNHCMNRMDNASDMRKNLVLTADMDKKTFQLQSSTNDRIQFELQFNSVGSRPHCTCPDFSRTRLPCKHFFYLFEKYSALTWSQLPSSYTENPFFTLDNDVLLVFNDHASAAQDNTQVTEIEEQANKCHEFSNDKKN
eukprot:gene2783-3220_t